MRHLSRRALAATLLLAGCYQSHGITPASDAGPPAPDAAPPRCTAERPTCVTRPDPCGPLALVAPECDIARDVWVCPTASRVYTRPAPMETCLPFHDGALVQLENGGAAVPVGDRCLYVAINGVDASGTSTEHPGFWMVDDGGTCPSARAPLGHDAFDRGDLAPLDAIHDAVQLDSGETALFARLYEWAPGEVFGVRAIGSVVGTWDARTERVVAGDALTWHMPPDFGEAALVHDGYVYAYSCTGPQDFLTFGCYVARARAGGATISEPRAWMYFAGGGVWVAECRDASVIAYGGPERSAIRRVGDHFAWVRIVGFGSTLDLATAPAPEGPWSEFTELAGCELPDDDDDAFCRDPLIHSELADPFDPERLVIQYSIASLAPDVGARRAAAPDAYWPRIITVRR